MDVEGAWRQGFTGRGVAVTILDDGIEKDHPGKGGSSTQLYCNFDLSPIITILNQNLLKNLNQSFQSPDLIKNYDPLASTDINDNDSDPNPRYDYSDSNRHGTRCAGQVSKFHHYRTYWIQ